MKIGDSVWYFDEKHRVYPPKEAGQINSGGPIWREHWREKKVVGETSRSWIVGFEEVKISKKDMEAGTPGRGWALSQSEIDDQEWLQHHRYRITRRIEGIHDPLLLRHIATLVGYDAGSGS